jgi:hypothetical protein
MIGIYIIITEIAYPEPIHNKYKIISHEKCDRLNAAAVSQPEYSFTKRLPAV